MAFRGLFQFPGLGKIIRGQFVFAHGTTPGVATVEVAPQAITTLYGDLKVVYEFNGFNETEIIFRDCTIESAGSKIGRAHV